MPIDPIAADKLNQLLTAISGYADPRRASAEWKQVYKILQSTPLPQAKVTHVVGMRDLAGLKAMLNPPAETAPLPDEPLPDADTCRKALRAFRKRLAATRLDDESRLGHSPLTKGQDSAINAIEPPVEWPASVWRELVRQGRLRDVGHGFYEITGQ